MIVALKPLPDELDRSYLGRMMRVNGARFEREILDLIAAWSHEPEKSRRELSGAELLARAAHLDVTTFVRLHTTLPLRRSIAAYRPDLVHGCPENKDMLFSSGMRFARNEAYLCLGCIESDLAEHGMSYWHRHHQLPGAVICGRHRVPLRFLRDTNCFCGPPSLWNEEAEDIDYRIVADAVSNTAVAQFLDMTRILICEHQPIPVERSVVAMRKKAMELGFQHFLDSAETEAPLVSDRVIDHYPLNWLEAVFPDIKKKVRGTWMSQLDGTLGLTKGASSYVAYLLTCGLLFESAEHAVRQLKEARKPDVRRRIANATEHQMKVVEGYVDAKGIYKNIRLNQRPANGPARAFLNGIGLIDFSGADARPKFVAAKAFFCEKKSLVESAKAGGIRVDVLEGVIRRMGSRVAMVWRRIE